MGSPLRFQAVMAALAIGGAVLFVQSGDDPPRPEPVFTFQDDEIDESSGLVDLGGTVLTVNDSGGEPLIYVVDSMTGITVGRTRYADHSVVDVEALARGPGGSIWVGDIGDNRARRSSVAVYEVPSVGRGEQVVSAQRYDLEYQGGARDAETLLVHPRTGRLYVVSKGLFAGRVFAAPEMLRTDRPNLLRPIGRGVGALVTDGVFFPDGRHALLRSYLNATVYDSQQWRSSSSMALPDQPQGEGIALRASGERVLVSTEGRRTKVFSAALPTEVLDAVALPPPSTAPSPTAAPGRSVAPHPSATPGGSVAEDGDSVTSLVALSVAVLAAALGVRVLFRLRASRPRSRQPR